MRLGLDYGGTKIEGIVLDAEGNERARARVPTPRFDYEGGLARDPRPARAARGPGRRPDRDRRHRRPRLGRPHAPAGSAWATPPGCTAATSAATSPRRSTARSRSPTTPTASRCPRRSTAAAPAPGGLRRDPRHRRRRRHRRARPADRGRQRHRRRMGPHPAADAAGRRAPGPLCSCGIAGHTEAWLSGPNFAADYARRKGVAVEAGPPAPEIVALAEAGDARGRARRCAATRTGSAARWPSIVNILDPDVIVLGGGLSNVARLYENVPAADPAARLRRQVQHPPGQNVHGDSSGVRGAAWL